MPLKMKNKKPLLVITTALFIFLALTTLAAAMETRGDFERNISETGIFEDLSFNGEYAFRAYVNDAMWLMTVFTNPEGDTFTVELYRQDDEVNENRLVRLEGFYLTIFHDKWHMDSRVGVFIDGVTEPYASNLYKLRGVLTDGARMYEFTMYPASVEDARTVMHPAEEEPEHGGFIMDW